MPRKRSSSNVRGYQESKNQRLGQVVRANLNASATLSIVVFGVFLYDAHGDAVLE